MATLAQWVEGARPRTLPNAVAPVIAGTGAAAWLDGAVWWKALLALVVALALIVGVNADATVRASKGPHRPIFPVAERIEMLAALDVVDAVIVFAEPTPVEMLTALRPDVHVKGADYAPPHGKPIPEAELVRATGKGR